MVRTGRVVDKKHGKPMVCFERASACARCGMCAGSRKKSVVAVYGDAEIGDTVEVAMPDAQVVKASVLAYAIPLGGLIGGLFLGNALFNGDEASMLATGLLLMGVCFLALKLLDERLSRKLKWRPQITAVLPPDEEQTTTENESRRNLE